MSIRRLENLLNSSNDGDLGDLVRRAADASELAGTLRKAVPSDAAAGIVSANRRDDGELVVLAASPAWAARLRFLSGELLDAAQRSGVDATSCRVRVSRDAG